MDSANIQRWLGDTRRWIDEGLRERVERAPVFGIDSRDPPAAPISKPWTMERVAALSTPEVRQLRENAERLGDAKVMGFCARVLAAGHTSPLETAPQKQLEHRIRLVPRNVAFGIHGVYLANRYWSRSGVMRGGLVLFSLWAGDIQKGKHGASRYLLWAPNVGGARPWSDAPGGQERLDHCRRAKVGGAAGGMLVYGQRIPGVLPDDRALSVEGVDAAHIIALRVDKLGDEYWATWGGTKKPRLSEAVEPPRSAQGNE